MPTHTVNISAKHGRSQDFTLEAQKLSAESAEEVGIGEGVPFPNRLGGLGSVVSSSSGVRVKPRPPTHF